MLNLDKNDYKVLVRIERKLLTGDAQIIPEFPELTETTIRKSLDKLVRLGLIILQKGHWSLTLDAQKLLQKHAQVIEGMFPGFISK